MAVLTCPPPKRNIPIDRSWDASALFPAQARFLPVGFGLAWAQAGAFLLQKPRFLAWGLRPIQSFEAPLPRGVTA